MNKTSLQCELHQFRPFPSPLASTHSPLCQESEPLFRSIQHDAEDQGLTHILPPFLPHPMLKSIFSQLPTTASVAARQRPSSNTSHSPLDHRHHNLTDIPTHPPLALPRTGRFPNHDIQLDRPLAAHEVDLAFNSEAQLSVNERIDAIATL